VRRYYSVAEAVEVVLEVVVIEAVMMETVVMEATQCLIWTAYKPHQHFLRSC